MKIVFCRWKCLKATIESNNCRRVSAVNFDFIFVSLVIVTYQEGHIYADQLYRFYRFAG